MKNIRNFCIIAHIDHGKSTLADRLLQSTGTISDRDLMDQVLDDMDLEREKGVTIKSHAIQINYKHKDGKEYILNLIDTPGHVDFSYEVSRALAACEGCLLLVDATQGIQALIFDSVFNSFRGIIVYYRILNGKIKKGDRVKFVSTDQEYDADEVGILKLKMSERPEVHCGDVGYIITGIKVAKEVKVGDTITVATNPNPQMVQGFEDVKPMVFAGIFPVDTDDFEELRDCMDKLQLNDASLTYELETSQALGFGFRCGFLGMLHMAVIQERLEREFNQTVITTVPNVGFTAFTTKGEQVTVNNPTEFPDPVKTERIEEPYIKAQIISKPEYIGNIMTLCLGKRGILINQHYLTLSLIELTFELPLAEIVFDFYDKLKSCTRGYASFDYTPLDYRESDIVKMDIMLNAEPLDALSALIHRSRSQDFGRKLCEKLKELVPRQQFQITIQAAIGAKIIARENISAMRKDVT